MYTHNGVVIPKFDYKIGFNINDLSVLPRQYVYISSMILRATAIISLNNIKQAM
jgi:hypothetical protein